MPRPMHVEAGWFPILRAILQTHGIPLKEVFAFGSRVHGRNLKRFSDLDLCIQTDKALDGDLLLRLGLAFAESDLPIKVDVIDWARTKPAFQEAIADDLTPLFPA